MNKIERLVIRWIAVKMKQGQRAGHTPQHKPILPKKKPPGARQSMLCTRSGRPPTGRLPLKVWIIRR
jgi:hypothetical protein